MKIINICLAFAIAFISPLYGIEQEKPLPQELESMQIVVQMLDALTGDTENPVWPGYDLALQPLVLTFENGHIYGLNLREKGDNWQAIKLETKEIFYSPIDHWGVTQAHMHPEFPIDDQKAYVFRMDLIKDDMMPFLVLIHERFHHHQFEAFTPSTPSEGYLDHLNVDNIALMQLEERLLIDFLLAEKDQKEEIIKDFFAVNKTRQQLLEPSSLNWERDQQRMEGLADYVSVKLFDEKPILPGFNGELYLFSLLKSYVNDENVAERAMKWRHYGVGATMGYALDFLKADDWKQKIATQGIGQFEIMEKTLQLSPEEIQKRVKKAKQAYQFNNLKQIAATSLSKYQKEIASAYRQYEEIEGVPVILSQPTGQSISGGGSSIATYQLADGSMLSIDDVSSASSRDHMWQLEFNRLPILFQKKGGLREFKVEEDLEVTIDQDKCSLQDLLKSESELSFHTIQWEGKEGRFMCEHPGKLVAKEGKVSIIFTN